MSRSLGPNLPPEIVAMTNGADLAAGAGRTFTLVTTGPDGWPSFALLSVGEVLATDEATIRLALWPGSTTTANLSTARRGVLVVVERDAWYVRFLADRGPDLAAEGMARAYFECHVEDVLHDAVTYATITSGITFQLPDPDAVIPRWRRTIDLLRAAPSVVRGVRDDPTPRA